MRGTNSGGSQRSRYGLALHLVGDLLGRAVTGAEQRKIIPICSDFEKGKGGLTVRTVVLAVVEPSQRPPCCCVGSTLISTPNLLPTAVAVIKEICSGFTPM